MTSRRQRLGDVLIVGFVAVVICVACWFVAVWAFHHDERAADHRCHTLGAEKVYTGHDHYLCVTIDGRVVGSW